MMSALMYGNYGRFASCKAKLLASILLLGLLSAMSFLSSCAESFSPPQVDQHDGMQKIGCHSVKVSSAERTDCCELSSCRAAQALESQSKRKFDVAHSDSCMQLLRNFERQRRYACSLIRPSAQRKTPIFLLFEVFRE